MAFTLDGVQVSSFYHSPSISTNFEYNQAVFANNTIPYGQHTMMVTPINDSVNSVLILFDYLIYTYVPLSPPHESDLLNTSLISTEANPGPNAGAIVGGTVGGVAALILVITSAICCRRHKRRTARQDPLPIVNAVEPFVLSSEMAPRSAGGTSSPIQKAQTGPLPYEV